MTPVEIELKELQYKLETLIGQGLQNMKAIFEIESKIDILLSKLCSKKDN